MCTSIHLLGIRKVSDRIGVRNKQNAYIKDHTVKQQVCWEGLIHDKS